VCAQIGDKSLVPYRQCSAGKVWPAEDLERALWIRRFVLTPVSFWQDNCFMGIQRIAAISFGLEARVVIRDAQTCNLSCQKITTFPSTRGAGLVQIAE
jgi:hypothetical protein